MQTCGSAGACMLHSHLHLEIECSAKIVLKYIKTLKVGWTL